MRYLFASILALSLSTESFAADIIGSFTGSTSLLTREAVTDDSVFQLRLGTSGATLFNTELPFGALNNSAFVLPGPAFLTDGDLDPITVHLNARAGSLDGVVNFWEDEITYHYSPHNSIDFAGEATVQEIRLSLADVRTTPLDKSAVIGAIVNFDVVGFLTPVPEPSSIILYAIGLAALPLLLRRRKSQ